MPGKSIENRVSLYPLPFPQWPYLPSLDHIAILSAFSWVSGADLELL
jgi:hypothetical protein